MFLLLSSFFYNVMPKNKSGSGRKSINHKPILNASSIGFSYIGIQELKMETIKEILLTSCHY